jgi:hypothetical protein
MIDVRVSLEKRLASVHQAFSLALDEYGDHVRDELILPICRKYQLAFFVYGREFYFQPVKDAQKPVHQRLYIGSAAEAQALNIPGLEHDLADAFMVLNTDLGAHQKVGNLVCSVLHTDIT